MQHTKDKGSTVATNLLPTSIVFRKLEHNKGTQDAINWIEDLRDAVSRTPGNVFRYAMQSVIQNKGLYEVKFPVEEDIKKQYKLTGDNLAAMMKVVRESAAAEAHILDNVQTAVHSVLVDLMGPSSVEVLKTNIDFRQNQRNSTPNPALTWKIIMETHVTKRDGEDEQSMNSAAMDQVDKYLQLKQRSKE